MSNNERLNKEDTKIDKEKEKEKDKNNNEKRKRRGDDEIISIQDALEDHAHAQKELYEEAVDQYKQNWGDEDKCTFNKGYITQPVYACKDCPGTFGMCYGCSMHCHLDHEIIELFKKRNFRCDCGTKRSPSIKCILQNKAGEIDNQENQYNQNFDGKYCYCKMPYNYDEDMVQCLFCFDWFHVTCIKLNSNMELPDLDEMSDFVCGDCVNMNQFLLNYPNIRLFSDEMKEKNTTTTKEDSIISITSDDSTSTTTTTSTTTSTTNESKSNDESICKRNNELIGLKCDLFCKDGWRDQLCKCSKCMEHYESNKCLFIFDKPSESDDEDVKDDKAPPNLFPEMDNIFQKVIPQNQQNALLFGYSQMKDKLTSLFQSKQQSSQVVTKEDIQSIFGELMKRQKKK